MFIIGIEISVPGDDRPIMNLPDPDVFIPSEDWLRKMLQGLQSGEPMVLKIISTDRPGEVMFAFCPGPLPATNVLSAAQSGEVFAFFLGKKTLAALEAVCALALARIRT